MTKSEYYYKSTKHHREAIAHHENMVDQGIHEDYHKQMAEHHRAALAKLEEQKQNKKPTKKDLGPMVSNPALT